MTSSRRRILIALALIAGAAVVYVLYRRSSGSQSVTTPLSTGAPTDQTPPSSGDSGGGGAGAGTATDPTSDILSTLAGENQQLLQQLLGSPSGLVSLAGQSLGAPNTIPGQTTPVAGSVVPATGTSVEQRGGSSSPSPVGTPTALDVASYAGFSTTTIDTGPAAGGVIYTPSPAEATAIDQSPNALQQIGSDAAQSAAAVPVPKPKTTTSVEQKTLAGSFGGGKTSGQVKKNL